MDRRLIAVVLLVTLGLTLAHIGLKWPASGVVQPNGDIPDIVRDWLSVRAVVGDGSPTDDLTSLGWAHLGIDVSSDYAHPRSPGALLLQLPLAALPADWVWPVAVLAVVVFIALLALMVTAVAGLSWPWILVVGIPLMWSEPSLASMLLGSQSPLIAVALSAVWLLARRGQTRGAGILLGGVAVLRLFPGLLIPMLWMSGRRRIALTATVTTALLTLLALFLPDITLAGQVNTLSNAPLQMAHNLSAGLPMWWTVLAVGGLVLFARQWDLDQVMVIGTAGMLALSPVVWNHYLVLLAVPIGFTVRSAILVLFRRDRVDDSPLRDASTAGGHSPSQIPQRT